MEGSVIWLYCTGNSESATPTITWVKNGVTLRNDPPHILIRSSSNVTDMLTSSSLVVDNFGLADDGSYMCQASDGTATVSSSTLSLTGRPCWFHRQHNYCMYKEGSQADSSKQKPSHTHSYAQT